MRSHIAESAHVHLQHAGWLASRDTFCATRALLPEQNLFAECVAHAHDASKLPRKVVCRTEGAVHDEVQIGRRSDALTVDELPFLHFVQERVVHQKLERVHRDLAEQRVLQAQILEGQLRFYVASIALLFVLQN